MAGSWMVFDHVVRLLVPAQHVECSAAGSFVGWNTSAEAGPLEQSKPGQGPNCPPQKVLSPKPPTLDFSDPVAARGAGLWH